MATKRPLKRNPLIDGATDDAFAARYDIHLGDALAALRMLYGGRSDFDVIAARILRVVSDAFAGRPADLRLLDLRRSQAPDWFQRETMVGYAAYVDRFAGDLKGVDRRVPYLRELGVTYLHLLPFLKTKAGRNDGGFAVSDYGEVDPAYGTMDDLRALTGSLRESGISLCADFVLNHTSDEHEWARRARDGDETYAAFYHFFADREAARAYEPQLSDVFPETAPGHFTFVEARGEWVWTTFYPYQWDLNYENPSVFEAVLKALLNLANHGVEVFRLDAAPFLWKRLGSDCRSQPEVFAIIRALRALTAIAAPGVLLKAEAIVPTRQLIQYLGAGEYAGKECQLAYNTTLMTLLWGALAEGDAGRMVEVLANAPPTPVDASWINYVRCHDEIGWSVLLTENPPADGEPWRRYATFAQDFYAGRAAGSFSRGRDYQAVGTSGAAASLCGLEAALAERDAAAAAVAIKRLLAMYAVAFAYGGAPLINMGDEIAMTNDYEFETRARYDGDGRWLHRGPMDWAQADGRSGEGAVGDAFRGFQRLVAARRASPELAKSTAEPTTCADGRVLALAHRNAHGELIVYVNLSGAEASVTPPAGVWRDRLADGRTASGDVFLKPYDVSWLARADQGGGR